MPSSSALRYPRGQPDDFTARLPPGSPRGDPGMVVQPYTDPGYGMPNAFVGNLNQAPGQVVGGALPVNAQQIDTGENFYEISPLERWLAQQRVKNAQRYEQLPGITSGPAPKPWGLDRSQLPQQTPPGTAPVDSGFIANVLNRLRPYDQTVDPRMFMGPQQQQPNPLEFNSPRWQSPYSDQQT